MLNIHPLEDPERVRWFLPPSKSHMIRWIALASQSDSRTNLVFQGTPGRDIESMAECMEKMGVFIERESQRWVIRGKVGGLDLPISTLNCGNSATTANLVSAIAACMDGLVEIDGDQSLRKRESNQNDTEKVSEKSDDPIRMYLREMGGVELLSRDGEIAIAKRIEAGKNVMINALTQSPLISKKIL